MKPPIIDNFLGCMDLETGGMFICAPEFFDYKLIKALSLKLQAYKTFRNYLN